MEQLHSIGITSATLMARLLGGKLGQSQITRIMKRKGLKRGDIYKYIEPSLDAPRKRIKGKPVKDSDPEPGTSTAIDVTFPTKEIRKEYIKDLRTRSKLAQGDPVRMTDKEMAEKYFYFQKTL